jgi:hypothetical protein
VSSALSTRSSAATMSLNARIATTESSLASGSMMRPPCSVLSTKMTPFGRSLRTISS